MASLKYLFYLVLIIAPAAQDYLYPVLREKKVLLGDKIEIDCGLDSSWVTVIWKKEGGELSDNTQVKNRKLSISFAKHKDAGTYTCEGNVEGDEDEDRVSIDFTRLKVTEDVCELEVDRGTCHSQKARWYYNNAQQKCIKFYYTGCLGNDNNFKTEQACYLTCGRPIGFIFGGGLIQQ